LYLLIRCSAKSRCTQYNYKWTLVYAVASGHWTTLKNVSEQQSLQKIVPIWRKQAYFQVFVRVRLPKNIHENCYIMFSPKNTKICYINLVYLLFPRIYYIVKNLTWSWPVFFCALREANFCALPIFYQCVYTYNV